MKQLSFDRNTVRFIFLGYIILAFLGAFILSLKGISRNEISFIDALFTASSAISMTGLTVKNTASDFSFLGQVVIITLVQIGGFGYMGLGILIYVVMRRKVSFSGQNLLKESLAYPSMNGVIGFFKKIVLFVFLVELVGALLLFLSFALETDPKQALWHALFHSIAAFNNAGFSTFETNLMPYRSNFWVNFVISSLIIIGGVGYFVVVELYFFSKKSITRLSIHAKLILYSTLILLVFSTAAVFLFEFSNPKSLGELSLFDKLLSSYFTAVNYRTSGFNTLDLSAFKDASLFFGSIFMFIGGGAGGTAGGIKITTAAVLLIYTYWIIKGGRTRIFKREITQETINKAFVIAVSSMIYVSVCIMLLCLIEADKRFIFILFETVSAFATVGLSVGDGGTLSLSALFSNEAKIVVIIMMITGRIGTFAFLISIFLQEKKKFIKYPEGKVYL